MEEHVLVRVSEVECVADLGCGPTEKITHGDDFALIRREPIHRAADRFVCFRVERALLGIPPRMRRTLPLSTPASADASEPSWIDGGLVVEDGGRRERDG